MVEPIERLKQAAIQQKPATQPKPAANDEVLAIGADAGPYLYDVTEVDAICKKIDRRQFGMYEREMLIFHFSVVVPEQHKGVVLKKYAQIKKAWRGKPMPGSANLQKMASAALGRTATKRDLITYALFLDRLFRCSVRAAMSSETGQVYTVIDDLISRLA